MLRKKRDELQDLKNNIVEPNTEKVNFPPELLKNKLMKLILKTNKDKQIQLKNDIVEPNTEKVNFPPELLKNKLMKLILKTNKDNQICKFCNQAINPLQKNNNNVLI